MSGKSFRAGGVINLANGEETKDIQLPKIAKDRLFLVEFVGVNGFVQQNQTLFVSLEVYTSSVSGIYPIVTSGTSTISDLAFPARRFGAQRVLLYADPTAKLQLLQPDTMLMRKLGFSCTSLEASSNRNCHTEAAKLVHRAI